ncbi:MAG: D-alanyl-D-alanine carboxypeptidase family protein [Armatimonadota bacterium]
MCSWSVAAPAPAIAKAPAAPKPPQFVEHPLPDGTMITAAAAILVDVESGRVLWEYNADKRMYPASLTKMMTGLLVAESGDLERVCVASKAAANTGESSIALQANEPLKLRQVLQASLIKSANDATVMLAEAVGGSVPQFVAMMNNRAAAMGLRGTHFVNPHGLHAADHYSTAADQVKIARVALQNEEFRRIVGTRETMIPWQGKTWMRKLINRNRLLLRWDECDGVKTGYTRQAGRCLAASSTVKGWPLLCVVLKSKDSSGDAQRLLQWGYRSYSRELVVPANALYEVRVSKGAARHITARPERPLYVVLKAGEAAPEVVRSRKPSVAPIALGQVVGTVSVSGAGEAQTARLLATAEVPRSLWARLCDIKLPQILATLLVVPAAGVLVYGASSKAARARRRRLQARKRKAHRPRKSNDQRRAS